MSDEIEEPQPSGNEELRLSPGDVSVGVVTFIGASVIDLIGHYGIGGMLVGSMATVLATGFGDEIILASKEVIALSRQVFFFLSGRQERQQLPAARKSDRQALPRVQEAKPTMMLPEEEFIDWEEGNMSDEEDMSDDGFPTSIRYEDIRHRIPRGHVLVGIGRSGIETRDKSVGACVWIVGLSGTGKTSTTVLRVEERRADGHKFLGVDPHFFKDDSLTNAVAPYARSFLKPMGKTTEEINEVLNAFLAEFLARKGGRVPKPWQKITLLVDEVNALVDPIDKQEEENADLLKKIARICGQEARNFNMGGIFISQQATGLSWLRKVALMVIVHQLLMQSEKKIACNEDTSVMEDMKTWPIGRTYVYGIGFGKDGPRTVQQPYFEPQQEEPTRRQQPTPLSAYRHSASLQHEYEPLEDLAPNPTRYEYSPSMASGMASGMASRVEPRPHDVHPPGQPLDAKTKEGGLPLELRSKIHLVLDLDAQSANQNDIIKQVWNVEPDSRSGRAAKDELKMIRAYIAEHARKTMRLGE